MKAWNYLLRTLVLGAMVSLVGYGAWEARRALRARDEALAAKDRLIAQKEQDLQRLKTALQLIKVDHRLARLEVLDQRPSADDSDRLETTVSFTELGPEEIPLGRPQSMTIAGDVAYVDALVIKFEDRYVEQGDVLRGTSVCLFRRLFGEFQQPSQGHPLDTVGSRPAAYSPGHEMSELEQELWRQFWQYANDPAEARRLGVRAIHGEAPFIKLQPGSAYRIELRASGGLTIVPGDEPAARGAKQAG